MFSSLHDRSTDSSSRPEHHTDSLFLIPADGSSLDNTSSFTPDALRVIALLRQAGMIAPAEYLLAS
ncbi:MAG: hypothetical protein CSA55_02985 [Ilumatobacter coccineus]|uniref:Uncharacterized protein n=1 Tax=Ilumatobacter coccineus TaxID=467094 RepID=A0A2G6KAN1_9ACTN|nr:MAG: hypothetical protein CSA55_02985 [Ilumatobacter coccineus]